MTTEEDAARPYALTIKGSNGTDVNWMESEPLMCSDKKAAVLEAMLYLARIASLLQVSTHAGDYRIELTIQPADEVVSDEVGPVDLAKVGPTTYDLMMENGIFPHKCTHPGCTFTVEYDDEPTCYTHSPDSGSSQCGYSARAEAMKAGEPF